MGEESSKNEFVGICEILTLREGDSKVTYLPSDVPRCLKQKKLGKWADFTVKDI